MGTKRVGLARTQALVEGLKRELNLSTETTLKNMKISNKERYKYLFKKLSISKFLLIIY